MWGAPVARCRKSHRTRRPSAPPLQGTSLPGVYEVPAPMYPVYVPNIVCTFDSYPETTLSDVKNEVYVGHAWFVDPRRAACRNAATSEVALRPQAACSRLTAHPSTVAFVPHRLDPQTAHQQRPTRPTTIRTVLPAAASGTVRSWTSSRTP